MPNLAKRESLLEKRASIWGVDEKRAAEALATREKLAEAQQRLADAAKQARQGSQLRCGNTKCPPK